MASRQLTCILVLVPSGLHAQFRAGRPEAFKQVTSALLKALACLVETGPGASGNKGSYGVYDQQKHSLFHLYSSFILAAKPDGNISDIHHREAARIRFARRGHSRGSSRKLHTSACAGGLQLSARLEFSPAFSHNLHRRYPGPC
jgi:hypothetical protein